MSENLREMTDEALFAAWENIEYTRSSLSRSEIGEAYEGMIERHAAIEGEMLRRYKEPRHD